MNPDQLLLIDLSGIAHQLWHVSGNEPDQDFVSNQIVARVHALSSAHPHTAICLDSGTSFRKALDHSYKAQRDTENRAPLQHQIRLAVERLKRDGYPCWMADGFEADDVIATATRRALEIDGATVLIASADKDLLQLVNDRVTAKSLTNGNLLDVAAVKEKFKIAPSQMLDYLSLVGDTSDNVKGANGIGGVIAARLLAEHGDLVGIYAKIDKGVVPGITPALRTNLQEFRERWPTVRALIALRTDVEIPFEEIAAEREVKPMESEPEILGPDSFGGEDGMHSPSADTIRREIAEAEAARPINDGKGGDRVNYPYAVTKDGTSAARKVEGHEPDGMGVKVAPSQPKSAVLDPVGPSALARYQPIADFALQLEPRDMPEAKLLATMMFESRLFGAYGTPQAVLATVLAGRELGMPAMASLRAFHVIESRPQLSADTIAALVLKSGKAKYFKPVSRTATAATFKTLRIGEDEEPFEFTYTIEEAKQAWKKDQKAWESSGWGKNPADMLVARAKSKLARLVYPDVVGGLYAVEEVE